MEKSSSICSLCLQPQKLSTSHVIPSFVYKWMKQTSATGFFRSTQSNQRLQDGFKIKMLCESCEANFSLVEQKFATNIFNPFVNQSMDTRGFPTGNISTFQYEEWLLKFAISIQWRCITFRKLTNKYSIGKWHTFAQQVEKNWREYLLGIRDNAGEWETHLIFLYNIESSTNIPPIEIIPDYINSYLLRSVDFDFVGNESQLGHFAKFGPILIWTYLKPHCSKNMNTSLIENKGEISPNQLLTDEILLKFIIKDRPPVVTAAAPINNTVIKRVKASLEKDPKRALQSMTYKILMSDSNLIKRKSTKKH